MSAKHTTQPDDVGVTSGCSTEGRASKASLVREQQAKPPDSCSSTGELTSAAGIKPGHPLVTPDTPAAGSSPASLPATTPAEEGHALGGASVVVTEHLTQALQGALLALNSIRNALGLPVQLRDVKAAQALAEQALHAVAQALDGPPVVVVTRVESERATVYPGRFIDLEIE